MKRTITLMAVISILSFLLVPESFAQREMKWQGSGNWGPGTQYGRLYNPQAMETLSGEVASVDTITPIKGMSSGVHVVVKADKETISVHLGPAWYIQRQDMKIAPGDKVEITGSRITFEGKPALIAAEVKKVILESHKELTKISTEERISQRIDKFCAMGVVKD